MTKRLPWPYVVAALLLLTACTSPDSAPAPSPAPNPLLGIKPPNTHQELRAALPTTFGKLRLELESDNGDPGYSARGDLFKGRKVEPESCRELMQVGGRTDSTYGDFPTLPTAWATSPDPLGGPTAWLVSLPAPYGEKWLDLYPAAAPQCTDMRIDGTERASIVERSIPGLGTRSRYVLRTYLQDGKAHREGFISFITPTYYARVSIFPATYKEAALIAYAHQLQTLADRRLR